MARHLALTGLALLLVAVLVLTLASGQFTQAQPAPSSLRATLERLEAAGTAFVVRFAAPVAGEFDVSLPGDSVRLEDIGDDYFCFSQLWNDTRRTYCTPYANITSVSFVQ